MKFPKFVAAALALVAALLLTAAGCRRAAMQRQDAERQAAARRQERQMFEIRRGGNIVAQTAETVELQADIHLAGEDGPRRAAMRVRPGTWLVPEQHYSAADAKAVGSATPGRPAEPATENPK